MSDKLEKNIKSSMIDEFLSDEDKPKPPKPAAPAYTGYCSDYYGSGYSSGGRGQSSFFDDDGPDPLDDDYYKSRRTSYQPPKTYTGVSNKKSSVFDRKTTHNQGSNVVAAGDDYPRQIASVIRTVQIRNGKALMEAAERDEIVGLMMKGIGVMLDKAGITWSTQGSVMMREMLKDFLPMAYVGGSYRIEIEGQDEEPYDPETGECMEENGNHE